MSDIKIFSDSKYFQLANDEYRIVQEKLLLCLKGVSGKTILDVGCNGGAFTIECAKAVGARHVYGIEIDEKLAVSARSLGIDVALVDASKPFPHTDNFFDVIIANQILEHVLDTDTMLNECFRVLKNGGTLVLSSPNLGSLVQRVLIATGRQPTTLHVSEVQVGNFLYGIATKKEHVHAFTLKALEDLLKYHKFIIEKSCGSGFYPVKPPASELLARIFSGLAVYSIIKAQK
jgi:2-polyprenyl-3-methyl-5-hydroxy-6-metoxy-1,4-benzoquinol methylase